MRLLNTSTYILEKFLDSKAKKYAIVSHCWLDQKHGEEIRFKTLNPAELLNVKVTRPGLDKIRGACAIARQQNPPLEWLWVDTCCIDKEDSREETESINSMFKWYSDATICYTYLHDVRTSTSRQPTFEAENSSGRGQVAKWFSRGWTLQELLASKTMDFYDCDWKFIGTKQDLAGELRKITRIDMKYLLDPTEIPNATIAVRMSWMAGRTTTRVEDIAYSILGILGVQMEALYGEGTRAFVRLQTTLMQTSSDESIFAWTIPRDGLRCFAGHTSKSWNPHPWGMLAPSPDCFKNSGNVVVKEDLVVPRLGGGYRWVQQGVQLQVSMKSGSEATNWLGLPRSKIELPLNCWIENEAGTPLTVFLHLLKTKKGYERETFHDHKTRQGLRPSTNTVLGIDQQLTRPLTIIQPSFDV